VILKKKYLVFLNAILNKYIKKAQVKFNSLNVKTLNKHIYPLMFFLKNHTLSQFKILTDLVCYDRPGKNFRFSLIYNLLSIDYNYRIKLQVKLKEKLPLINTMTALYSGAG
jgi:NADH dehydrogenase (ubiquinone) Fe-S protein 3